MVPEDSSTNLSCLCQFQSFNEVVLFAMRRSMTAMWWMTSKIRDYILARTSYSLVRWHFLVNAAKRVCYSLLRLYRLPFPPLMARLHFA